MTQESRQIKFSNLFGGLASSKFLGSEFTFSKGVGIDFRSEPGIIKAQQALKKESGAVVVDLITADVHTSAGHSYFFGDKGNIYKRTSGGTWSKLSTLSGGEKILGSAEHSDGYVYFTYTNKVGRIKVSDDGLTVAWNTLTNTNTSYGPVIYHEKQDQIYIGNQEIVAQVDASSTFTAEALNINGKYVIRGIGFYDLDVMIGATDGSNHSRFFQWDGIKSSWQYSYFFGGDIKWLQNNGEKIYFLSGDNGKIFTFPNDLENPFIKIPGDYSGTAKLTSSPNAVCIHNNLLNFGIEDSSTGTPAPNGVYTYGTNDVQGFPPALNCEYAISSNDTTQINIGSVSSNGSDLFVGWYDGTNYGVDVIDTVNKYSSAFIEFRLVNAERETEKIFERFPCAFKKMLTDCGITMKQKVDHASTFSTIATVNTAGNTDDQQQFNGDSVVDGYIIQIRLDLTTSGNNTPEIEETSIVYTPKDFV